MEINRYISQDICAEQELASVKTVLRICQGFQFPRTVSTYQSRGQQMEIVNMEKMLMTFKLSKFIDCRINAYPKFTNYMDLNMPSFVMCDLDLSKFRTEKLLLKALDQTLENIKKDINGIPMILFTGNGYHVYQPIRLPVLEQESIFSKFENSSTEFIRYAAHRWTNGKNDPSNHPSVNSCLLRVPGSVNSKNNKKVEIIQEWNNVKPAANQMLTDFYLKLAARRLARRSKQKEYYYQRRYMGKNYKHFGHVTRVDLTVSAVDGIAWIENLLNNSDGITDFRKLMIDLVIAPYLVNIKQYDYDIAYSKIAEWLDKCGMRRRLDFNPRHKISYALKRSLKTGIKPMKLETMKNNYCDVYKELINPKRLTS
jgi:hypothetical protein